MIGIGLDAVEVARFRAVLSRRPSILERLFSATERNDMAQRADPVPGLAARFAAKEATMKAFGVGLATVHFSEIEVHSEESGAPRLVLSGRAAKLAEQREVNDLALSLTHSETIAAAVVLIS